MSPSNDALLVLADGTVFEGEAIGAAPRTGVTTGEVVFNTVMSGYQEVITDPSYAGQVIAFTYPHIGNYGVVPADDESGRPFCRGVVVRDLARRPSSWRAADDLSTFLQRHDLAGIAGVDTRRLTRHIREAGSMPCAFGTADETTLKQAANDEPGTDGVDLVATVTTAKPYFVGGGELRVVAYDYGIKRTILHHLSGIATVEVVPANTPASEVLGRQTD
ncbi:MAG: carbamoyl-phosphate synthase small subunit, partial [Acidimicrobiaceae bacterium]|nr:carbamoyl-phosphate synthase small subunit [Acidimicrobiaceae bacterium]